MRISFDKSITQDIGEATRREWLETNGLGGWASATICGANTRRYHGLLVAATRPPAGRLVLISKLDETLLINGQQYELGCNYYPESVIHPRGYQYLSRFQRGIFPQFDYHAGGIHLRKTVAAIHGENTTVVSYQVLKAPAAFILQLQPFFAMRDIHSLTHANAHIQTSDAFQQGIFHIQPYPDLPAVFLSMPGAAFQAQPDWYYRFEYPMERYRGLDYQEDLFTPGTFSRELRKGDRLSIILSTENPQGRHAFQLMDKERRRRQSLSRNLPVKTDFIRTLALAADQFIVQRGDDSRTIIAGYHWFTDWGRDTMISLPGLCLATGRYNDAKKILETFARHTSRGMLPNRFPESGETPQYNTADASLWFFVAVYRYWQYTRDEKFLRKPLMPVLQEILEWHERGTRYGIHVDSDGLLCAGEPGVQLTWMDAKVGDRVVTPRQGKAVEINALWYNALKIFAELSDTVNDSLTASRYAKKAAAVRKQFNELFWNEAQTCLLDYIDGNYRDATIRPNQVFALSLPFPLLSKARARAVLTIVEDQLLTTRGLRSLSSNDPDYRPVYGGDRFARDSAYHQGTVWGWLLGPFITALVTVRGAAGKKQAKKLLKAMETHLADAGVGTVSEIFDGDPPHTPRGCIAQAWSVAELLRACVEDVEPAARRSVK